jgi:hypothetical protein
MLQRLWSRTNRKTIDTDRQTERETDTIPRWTEVGNGYDSSHLSISIERKMKYVQGENVVNWLSVCYTTRCSVSLYITR